MATIDSQSSPNYPSARWSLEYTIGTSSLGKTTINYTLYTKGRNGYSSNTALATFCYMNIYDTDGSLLKSYTHNSTSAISFTGQNRDSGSFTVTHNNSTGKGSFTVSFSVQFYPYTSQAGLTSSSTVNIPGTSFAYTACSAPTSVTASGFVAPNGSFTISWSGASGGVSNSISGYEIYWRVTSEGSAPSTSNYTGNKSITSTSSSGSTTITLGEVTRGYKVVCGIVTKGSAGSQYYSGIKTGGNVTVNTLPTKPAASAAPTLIPSTGGVVNFTLETGTDIDNQSLSLRYATSPTGQKTVCGTNLSLNITQGATYYFWTYDGVEDSSEYATVTIISNTKPTISISSKGTEIESNNATSSQKYVINPKITLVQGNNGQKINSYNFYIYHSTNQTSWTKTTISERQDSLEKSITDVRSLDLNSSYEDTGFYYYFSAQRYDGLEWSDEFKDNNIYYIPKRPQLLNVYNTGNFVNIENTEFQNYFSKVLSFAFDRDQGYNSLEIYNKQELIVTISLSTLPEITGGKWQNINLVKGLYNLQVRLGKTESEYYSSLIDLPSLYKIANLEAKNLYFAQETFEVYIPDLNYNYNLYNTFNTPYENLNEEVYKEYGILNIEDSFYAKINIENKNGITQSLKILSNTDRDTIYFNLTSEQLYQMLPEIENKNLTYNATLTVGFLDIFNERTEVSKTIKVNYGVEPECANISLKVEGDSEVNTWPYLKEGMPLTLSGEIKTYNSNPKIQLLITRIKDSVGTEYAQFGKLIDLTKEYSSISGSSAQPGQPIIFTFENIEIITIGEISELDYKVNFKILVTTDAINHSFTSDKLYAKDVKVRGHSSQGAVTLTDIDFNTGSVVGQNSTLKFKYNNIHPGAITDLSEGYNLSLMAKIQYRNISTSEYADNFIDIDINTLQDYLLNSNKANEVTFAFPENIDALVCRLILYTSQTVTHENGKNYETSYVVYSNEQALYNILPTVSYRKNLLGINSSNLENYSNAVLVVGEHSSKNIIYLVSSDGIKTINTTSGELNGFIVNCGTWDEI